MQQDQDLLKQIKLELKDLKNIGFTGKLKIGIENSNFVAVSLTSKTEGCNKNNNFENLEKLLNQNIWGCFELYLIDGEVVGMEYSNNFQGENLKKRMRDLKCKYVKVVARK